MFVEVSVVDPFELQWHFAIGTLHQFHVATMGSHQPATKLDTISDGRRQQHDACMTGKHSKAQLPNNASLWVVKRMKLVHHDGRHGVKRFRILHQSVEQYLSDHNEDGSIRIHAAIAGDEADAAGGIAPSDSGFLNFCQFLIGQGDQRGRVIALLTRPQRFVNGCLGDQCFSGSGGSANQHTLFASEPGQQRFLLDRVRRIQKSIEVFGSERIAINRLVVGFLVHRAAL